MDYDKIKQDELKKQSDDANMRQFIQDNLRVFIIPETIRGEPYLTIELCFRDQVSKKDFIDKHSISFKEITNYIIK